jgi:hypothetical protein
VLSLPRPRPNCLSRLAYPGPNFGRDPNRRMRRQPMNQTKNSTNIGLTKTLAAIISHCAQIETLPIGVTRVSPNRPYCAREVDEPFNGSHRLPCSNRTGRWSRHRAIAEIW